MVTDLQSNIEEVLSQYLTMPTNYAILINGKRGAGKTYCIKTKISKLITSTKVFDDQSADYKFLYISLYGIKSIDDIYSMMALELYPFIKSKSIQIGLGISKILLRGFLNVKKAGNIDDYLLDVNDIAKTAIDTKNFVFVFDDIDRKSSDLDINNLIGFINSLVEHENNKVILVADSEYITDDNYKDVKEKTIGTIIDYSPPIDQIYDEISKGFSDRGHPTYEAYLQYFKPTILECFSAKGSNNLRIMIFLFEHLFIVFGEVYDDLKLSESKDKNSYNLNKLNNAIKFASVISIEFRIGNITFKERKQLDSKSDFVSLMNKETIKMMFESSARDEEKKAPLSDFELLLKTYFPKHDYHYYSSVYNFFTGGTAFNKKLLLAEWKEYYDDLIRIEEPQYTLYNNLHLTKCLDLSNPELKKQTKEMLDFALKGKYTLDLYFSVYYYIERFNDILKYNMDNVAKRLVFALERHKNNFIYVPMLSYQFDIEKERPLYEQYLLIFRKAIEVNKHVEASSQQSKREDFYSAFVENPQGFYDEVLKNSIGNTIFSSWNVNKLFNHIKEMQPSELLAFSQFLGQITSALNESEKPFFRLLLTKINTMKPRKNLKAFVLDIFRIRLDSVLSAPSYN